jgi:hypothetical protein
VVLRHGRRAGRSRSPRGAAVCLQRLVGRRRQWREQEERRASFAFCAGARERITRPTGDAKSAILQPMNVWPLVLVVVGLAGAVVTIRWSRHVWLHRKELPARVQPIAVVVAGTTLLGPLTALLGVAKTFGAVGGESVDPQRQVLSTLLAWAIRPPNATSFSCESPSEARVSSAANPSWAAPSPLLEPPTSP